MNKISSNVEILRVHPSLLPLQAKIKIVYRLECVIAEQNNIIESHNEKRKAILQHISKPHGENGGYFFFFRLMFSVFVYCKGKKDRKGKKLYLSVKVI